MKKIAYIELDTHAELANNFYELTKNDTDFYVDFYVSKKILELLNLKSDHIFLTKPTELLNLLSQKNYDLIIIGTVHRNFNLYHQIVSKYKTAIVVHNINFSNATQWELFKNMFKKDRLYRFKLFLKEGLILAPEVYQKAFGLLCIDEYVSKQNNLIYFPIHFKQFDSVDSKDQTIRIIISGSVSQDRRDYYSFYKKLKNFKNRNLKYEIIFLGKAAGEELGKLKKLQEELPPFIKFIYFEEKVSQNEFDHWMMISDVLYSPIQNKTEFFSIKEFYGITKVTGNIGDAIKYGKPIVLPSFYNTNLNFAIAESSDLQTQFAAIKKTKFDYSSYSSVNIEKRLKLIIELKSLL